MNSSQELLIELDSDNQPNRTLIEENHLTGKPIMIEVLSLEKLYAGTNYVQSICYIKDSVECKAERILLKPKVIIVTHDIVNDKTVLIHDYKLGAMQYSSEFPTGSPEAAELAFNAAKRILKETTGLEAKSIEVIHDLMVNQEDTYAPITIFYCTVDTRDLINDTPSHIRLIGGKDLIREAGRMKYQSLGVILGSQYIKQQRHKR